ncbi:Hcp family type VI secretion system effector [Trabulsiella guamensis ATCC 49490]|uniref:Hcp family type VI secretion system effector n=1 Tax=Trabulsiella guamensis ATCC 49490 TaxID=1005994 RepID=A0A084ZU13_9ENTR|nr:type VI secretion system tube protein TssD [Trabulsiella guamensis]KFC00958.1 Hcp family type VI secretion system effector [Trabulsiella guamensis ATCC 49490]
MSTPAHLWLTDKNGSPIVGGCMMPTRLGSIDQTTPILFRALCEGRTLKSATIRMYRITEAGIETEYFNIVLENVKISSITPSLLPGGVSGTHMEAIELRYENITWKYTDGNILFKDGWNVRWTA